MGLCVLQYLDANGVSAQILALPTSEPNKSFNLVFQISEQLEKFGLNRCSHTALHVYRSRSLPETST